jgi:hypothetical protein
MNIAEVRRLVETGECPGKHEIQRYNKNEFRMNCSESGEIGAINLPTSSEDQSDAIRYFYSKVLAKHYHKLIVEHVLPVLDLLDRTISTMVQLLPPPNQDFTVKKAIEILTEYTKED